MILLYAGTPVLYYGYLEGSMRRTNDSLAIRWTFTAACPCGGLSWYVSHSTTQASYGELHRTSLDMSTPFTVLETGLTVPPNQDHVTQSPPGDLALVSTRMLGLRVPFVRAHARGRQPEAQPQSAEDLGDIVVVV